MANRGRARLESSASRRRRKIAVPTELAVDVLGLLT